jgi:hypothetical protein
MSITEYLSAIGKKGGQAAAAAVDTKKRAQAGGQARWAGHKKLSKAQKNKQRRDRWAAHKGAQPATPGDQG